MKTLDVNEKILRELQSNQYKTSHVLHFLLTLITAGLWIPVWFIVAQSNASKRVSIKNETGLFSKIFMILVSIIILVLLVLIIMKSGGY